MQLPSHSAEAVGLGTADSYAVLAGSTVTNTGDSDLWGDLGLYPGTSVAGFPPGEVGGTTQVDNEAAGQAQADLTVAYNNAAGQAPDDSIAGDLGGDTLTSGVYNASSSIGLTGALTLDAEGDPNALFIFQIGSALTTAPNSSVVLINGAQPCNVFWQIGSSATLDTDTEFVGTIMALTSITLNNGATVDGRALASNGAVTLDDNVFTRGVCDTSEPSPSPSPSDTATPSPTPSNGPSPSTPPHGNGSGGNGGNGSAGNGVTGDGSALGASTTDTLPNTGPLSIGQGPLFAIALAAILSGLALIAGNTRRARRQRP